MVPGSAMALPTTSNVWVVMGALNEAKVIADVVADVKSTGHRVVVVDDGSRDDTAARAATAGAIVIQHPLNLGQGAPRQTAIDFALAKGADFIVTFDADGQHPAADIASLLAALTSRNADFALGSRFLGSAVNMPSQRRLLLTAA